METFCEEQHAEHEREWHIKIVAEYGERKERFCHKEPDSVIEALNWCLETKLGKRLKKETHFDLHCAELAKEYMLPETTDKNRAKDQEICENLLDMVSS